MHYLYLLICLLPQRDSLPVPKTQQLSAITVKAQRPTFQQTAYGTTVNVENSPLTKGSNTLEVLQRAPGVFLDLQHNNLMLNGKSGVKVMINGKLLQLSNEQVLTLLQNMGADAIDRIELMPTPPAQYDANGSAGLINIVLKQNRRPGNSAGFTASAGYGYREKARLSASMSHNQGKEHIAASYSFAHDHSYGQFGGMGNEIMPQYNTGLTTFDFLSRSTTQSASHYGTLAWEHSFKPNTSAGISLAYENDHNRSQSHNSGNYFIPVDSLLHLEAALQRDARWKNTDISGFFKDQHWNVTTEYLDYHITNPVIVNSTFLNPDGTPAGDGKQYAPQQQGISNTRIQVGVFTLDHTQNLGTKIKLDAGIKATYTRTASQSGIESLVDGSWQSRPGSTAMQVGETIAAAYVATDIKLDTATTLRAGLRYEYAQTRMDDRLTAKHLLTRRQGGLYPSVFITRRLGEAVSLQASYTRRVSRPSYNDLSSLIEYNDPLSVFTGNPLLKPTTTANYKAGISLHAYSFTVQYSYDHDPIVGGQLMDGPERGVVYISPQNMRYQKALDLQAVLPFKVTSWWQMNYSILAGWHTLQLDYLPQPGHQSFFTMSLNYTETFLLPRSWSIELSGWYNSANYYGTARNLPYAAINAGIRKVLPKEQGTLSLSTTNPVRLAQMRTDLGVVGIDAFRTHARVVGNPESTLYPIVKISYSRTFGGHAADKGTGSATEEKNRVRGQ